MKVWDAAVRGLHWVLAAGIAAAWLTSERWTRWHAPVGYGVLAVVGLRIIWGCVGSPYARFRQFVRSPADTARYAAQWLRAREPRYLGHNPLGGWMALVLWACVVGVGATGGLLNTDRFWGDEGMHSLHGALAWMLLALIAVHLSGVIFASVRHRENLVRAMFSGSKREAQESDVS
ncbi:MAG: cytochrome b/b6 domain-containing protein [Rhizobacter sp.]|nr:cytochrome b/b6 domain-containing protein [Rhizobacter sp.]